MPVSILLKDPTLSSEDRQYYREILFAELVRYGVPLTRPTQTPGHHIVRSTLVRCRDYSITN